MKNVKLIKMMVNFAISKNVTNLEESTSYVSSLRTFSYLQIVNIYVSFTILYFTMRQVIQFFCNVSVLTTVCQLLHWVVTWPATH